MSIHSQCPPTLVPRKIAIVGSTGFLGPYITAALLRKDNRSQILCLNRNNDGEDRTMSALKRLDHNMLQHSSRLCFFNTNITKPSLGLDATLHKVLASEVHEIIFNAWSTNWVTPLERFKPLLHALQSAIDICIASPRKPRLIFISSTSALGDWSQIHPEQPVLPEEPACDEASATKDGYGQSKRMAEQLLVRAQAQHRLRVAIVRAGLIGGPSLVEPRPHSWPIQGSVYVLIKTSQRLGKWPTQVNALDWIPVDALAEGVAGVTATVPSEQKVRVYNMMHPKPVHWELLYKTLRDRFGLRAKQVTLPEWLEELNPETFKLHGFLQRAGMGREQSSMIFRNQNALQLLPNVETLTEQQLATWLQGWNLELGKDKARL